MLQLDRYADGGPLLTDVRLLAEPTRVELVSSASDHLSCYTPVGKWVCGNEYIKLRPSTLGKSFEWSPLSGSCNVAERLAAVADVAVDFLKTYLPARYYCCRVSWFWFLLVAVAGCVVGPVACVCQSGTASAAVSCI